MGSGLTLSSAQRTHGASQGLLSIMGAIPMAVAAVFVVPLANKFGKRLVCGGFMLLGAVGGIIAGLGGGNIVPVAIGVASSVWVLPRPAI